MQFCVHKVTSTLACGGWIGVDLFFVLSGFLVSGLLFKEHRKFGSISAKHFLIRRGFKIYPAFWMLIAVTVIVKLLNHRFQLAPLLSELLFVQNYGPFWWGHTWSLAVEEHFYLLLVALLAYLSVRNRPANPFAAIPITFFILAIASLLARLLTARGQVFDYWTHQFHSHLRLDSLFFGVLLSYFYHYKSQLFIGFARRFRWLLVVLGILALSPAFIFRIETTPWMYTFGFALFYVGSGALLVGGLAMDLPDNKIVRFSAYLGSHWYSIYLWHFAVSIWLVPIVARIAGSYWTWPTYAVSYVASCLFIGVAMGLLVEFPTLRIRDRWFPSRARTLIVSRSVNEQLVSVGVSDRLVRETHNSVPVGRAFSRQR